MDSIDKLISSHLANVNSGDKPVRHIPLEVIDGLADELVAEYDNSGYRAWYCGVVIKFGVAKVMEWRRRAAEGERPGRLFTTYVNQAGGYRRESKGADGRQRTQERPGDRQ